MAVLRMPHDLARPEKNAVCSALLVRGWGQDPTEGVNRLRDQRIRTLAEPVVEPTVLKNKVLTEADGPRAARAVARHLRGIEVWGTRGPDRERTPRLASVAFTGADEIKTFYDGLTMNGAVVDWILKSDVAHDDHFSESSKMSIIMGMAMGFSIPAHFAEAGLAHPESLALSLGVLYQLGPFLRTQAFRYQKDHVRDRFDDQASTLFEENRRRGWVFATRTYRVLPQVADAIWAKDREAFAHAVRQQEGASGRNYLQRSKDLAVKAFISDDTPALDGGLRQALWPRRVNVILDLWAGYNEAREAHELIATVRTTSGNPTKFSKPSTAKAARAAGAPISVAP